MPTQTVPAQAAPPPTIGSAAASLKRTAVTAVLYTLITAVLLGIAYPLLITVLAHGLFPRQADGKLITRNGQVIGSSLIGQSFTGPGYFHSRPSAAGTGYDATSSGGSNLGPSSQALQTRIAASAAQERATRSTATGVTATSAVPVDLVTASGSGLDPDITPAAALYQAPRIALERHLSPSAVQSLITRNTTPRQLGLLGEPRVNLLQLNLALDALAPATTPHPPATIK